MQDIGRNAKCLCGSGLKYKACCWGVVDWNAIAKKQPEEFRKYLSIRGRNTLFLARMKDILGIDLPPSSDEWQHAKDSMNAATVTKVYEAVIEAWPPDLDYETAIHQKDDAPLAGLYTGHYTPFAITEAISRHALYSERILVFDPLLYPPALRPEFNPLARPEIFVTDTLKHLWTWCHLAPWIYAGIVNVLRSPSDYDTRFAIAAGRDAHERFAHDPELANALDADVKLMMQSDEMDDMRQWNMLVRTDDALRSLLPVAVPGIAPDQIELAIAAIHRLRLRHPYYSTHGLGPANREQLIHTTSGENHEGGLLAAKLTGAYLFTNLGSRWKEIERDRQELPTSSGIWTPFAKAWGNAKLQCLSNVDLAAALRLRNEGRLQDMRMFLARAWRASRDAHDFAPSNVHALEAELDERLKEAEYEYQKIADDLRKFAGIEVVLGIVPRVATAESTWLPYGVAAIATGATALWRASAARRRVAARYPAAFFLRRKR
jgi:hypothetical protein